MLYSQKSPKPPKSQSPQNTINAFVHYSDSLEEFQDSHSDDIGDFCDDFMTKLKYLGWEPWSRCARFRFEDPLGYDEDCFISISFPLVTDRDNDVSGDCSCDDSESLFPCEHTYAACELLFKMFADPSNPLLWALIGVDLPKALNGLPSGMMDTVRKLLGNSTPMPPVAPPPPPKPTFLKTLDSLIQRQESAATANTNQEPSNGTRLLWRVTITENYNGRTFHVAPTEQELKKDGTSWKKGKVLNWAQIASGVASMSGPQDEAVRSICKKLVASSPYNYGHGSNSYYGQQPEYLDLIEALAGSSRTVLGSSVRGSEDEDVPLAIAAGPLSLKCEVQDSVLRLIPMCHARAIARTQRLSKDKSNRLIGIGSHSIDVVRCPTPDLQQLAYELLHQDACVPLADASGLLSQLAKLSNLLKVEMPTDLMAPSVVADKRTFMELITMQPQGLCVRMRTRPADGAALGLPGDPRAATHVVQDGRLAAVVRDVDQEELQAREIAVELGLSRFPQMTDWDWRIPADGEMLDFLVQLADRQRSRLIVIESTHETSPETDLALSPVVPFVQSIQQLGQIPDSQDLVVLWPKGDAIRITGEIDAESLILEVEDRDDWFGLKGTVRVDGHEIPLMTLISAMKAGRRIVPLGGGLFARISDEFYERLQAIGDVVHQTQKGLEVDITAAPALKEFVNIGDNLKLCESWHQIMRRLDEAADVSTDPPLSLTADLREYQLEGYRWMKRLSAWGVGGCLADDMGLGKTVQALALLLDRKEEGPTLVVAPMSVGFNWLREAERFAPSLNMLAYRESNRDEVLKSLGEGDVVVVSYAMMQRDAEKFQAVEWGTLVLDEAQNVKNAETKTARAVRDLNAKWRLALSGTPIENRLSELWALFRTISPGLFGSWERFRTRFVTPIEKGKDAERRVSLARLIKPFILRRTKDDVLKDLPERIDILTTLELSDAERKLYEDARLRIVAELSGLDFGGSKDHRFVILAAITKLRQLACHPALCDPKWKKSSAKLDALMELVSELREEGHRALIFSQFTQHLALVRTALNSRGISFQYLDGKSTSKMRQKSVDAFQGGEGDVFLISLKAGGTGLNLTAADFVIHLDPWWNPAVEDQASDRAHRLGQTRPVTVYRLVTKDTIEEKILALHDRKRELVASILDGTDDAGKLSSDELIDLIKTGGLSKPKPVEVDVVTGDLIEAKAVTSVVTTRAKRVKKA